MEIMQGLEKVVMLKLLLQCEKCVNVEKKNPLNYGYFEYI